LYGKFPWKGKSLWQHGTAYGDGAYRGSDGVVYGVDAGLIGIVPVDVVSEDANLSLGSVVEFPTSFSVQYVNGEFTFGHITIDTDPSYDEDEDDYEDYEDEEEEDEDF